MSVEVQESRGRSRSPGTKLLAISLAALLLTALVLSYLVRGTEGIAIFVSLAVLIGILFAWRTH